MHRHLLTILALLAIPGSSALGQDLPLFASHDPLHISIAVRFDELCRPRETENCDFTATTLEYTDTAGYEPVSIPIEIKVRGGWRSLSKNCSVPLLWVRMDPEKVRGTLFEGQTMLPLTTHCGTGISLESMHNRVSRSAWEQYILKEQLAHEWYEAVSPFSVRSRLARIHYTQPDNPNRAVHSFAFFAEHFDSMAARNGVTRVERGNFDAESLDADGQGRVALFNYLIANTDWSIPLERNITLVQDEEGTQIPVPFDFDMSGLVNTHYAGPAPGLPIDSVQERYFLGFCHPDTNWEQLFDAYIAAREKMYAAVEQIPAMSKSTKTKARGWLDSFFDTIQSAERDELIAGACQAWPPAGPDHTQPASGKGRR